MSQPSLNSNDPIFLNRLQEDRHLRFLTKEDQLCALFMWILELKIDNAPPEYRLLYGWIIPYRAPAKRRWNVSYGNKAKNLQTEKGVLAYKFTQVTLYETGRFVNEVVDDLLRGLTISEISQKRALENASKIEQFRLDARGNTFNLSHTVFCPAKSNSHYVPDDHPYYSPFSRVPAFALALSPVDKIHIFNHTGQTSSSIEELLTSSLCYLASQTGIYFENINSTRLGNIEWIWSPFADVHERYGIRCKVYGRKPDDKVPPGIQLEIDNTCFRKIPTDKLLIRWRVFSGKQVIFDKAQEVKINPAMDVLHKFDIGEAYDRVLLNIWMKEDEPSSCWTIWYEENIVVLKSAEVLIGISGLQANAQTDRIKDIIEKSEKARSRAMAVSKISRSDYSHRIQAQDKDGYVDSTDDYRKLIQLIHKKAHKSGAWFFPKGWPSGHDIPGDMQFWEWFNTELASRTDDCTIMIIDPYFGENGITEFIVRATTSQVKFEVLTNTQAISFDDGSASATIDDLSGNAGFAKQWLWQRFKSFLESTCRKGAAIVGMSPRSGVKTKPSEPRRAARLRFVCEQSRLLMAGLQVRLLDLRSKNGGAKQLFHDRYIIVLDKENHPETGFHLSNSLQGATKKAPLLITPIPFDVLDSVYQYVSELKTGNQDTEVIELFSSVPPQPKVLSDIQKETLLLPSQESIEKLHTVMRRLDIDPMVLEIEVNPELEEQIQKLELIIQNATDEEFHLMWTALAHWIGGSYTFHILLSKFIKLTIDTLIDKSTKYLMKAAETPVPLGTKSIKATHRVAQTSSLLKKNFEEALLYAKGFLEFPCEDYRLGLPGVRLAIYTLLQLAPRQLVQINERLWTSLSAESLETDNNPSIASIATIIHLTLAESEPMMSRAPDLQDALLRSSLQFFQALGVQIIIMDSHKSPTDVATFSSAMAKLDALQLYKKAHACAEFIVDYLNYVKLPSDAVLRVLFDALSSAFPGAGHDSERESLVNRLGSDGHEGLVLSCQSLLARGSLQINDIANIWTTRALKFIDDKTKYAVHEQDFRLIRITADFLSKCDSSITQSWLDKLDLQRITLTREYNQPFARSRNSEAWRVSIRGLLWVRILISYLIKTLHTCKDETESNRTFAQATSIYYNIGSTLDVGDPDRYVPSLTPLLRLYNELSICVDSLPK